jgi:hypothetical protein
MTKSRTAPQYLPGELMGNPAHCISATVAIEINAPKEQLFDWFTDLDISRVLNGYGPLPAVIRTVEQSGPWTVPGQRRGLEMSGNITATQQILNCVYPDFFAYRVTGFTHLLDYLAHGAEARWWFTSHRVGTTNLRWTYTFWPRSLPGKLAIYPVIRTLWTWYMREAIREMKRLAERETS